MKVAFGYFTLCVILAIVAGDCRVVTQIARQTHMKVAAQGVVSGIEGRASRQNRYAGDAACLSCHQDQGLSYLQTAHHLTSQLGNRSSILGSFQDGFNTLMVDDTNNAQDDSDLYFAMDRKDNGYYQTALSGSLGHPLGRNRKKNIVIESARMDIVIGSGVRGQSYLYWKSDQLYELPVSYWSAGRRWINSSGYENGSMNFSRPVYPRCLECHATYINQKSLDGLTNRYDSATLITGISCESCHGTAIEHVAMQQKGLPSAGIFKGQAILNPAKCSRDRQVDMCALCHSGTQQEEISPAFSYIPGQPLDLHLKPNSRETEEHPNLHANQVGQLKKSRCYLSSPEMSCSTCHNVHAPERTAASYSTRCLSCHQVKSCGMYKTVGSKIANNCIDCHMPVETTPAIFSKTADQLFRPKMRTHWIKIYR